MNQFRIDVKALKILSLLSIFLFSYTLYAHSNASNLLVESNSSSSCNFTITNNTDCDIYLYWFDGANYYTGASIPAYGSATETINDGDWWSAYNSADGSLITPYFSVASCSAGSDVLPSYYCGTAGACNYTIANATNCDIYLLWTDGTNFYPGIDIPANSSGTEYIVHELEWSAYNSADGSLITSTFIVGDCFSNFYLLPASACSATCSDGAQNQGEQGVDCGGPCPACPSCFDGIQNQGETGVDCGGPCSACATCSDGIQNQGELGIDCGGPCSACPTCNDNIQNQGETGVDCGGPCSACASCTDGIQNQGELGVDCGGPCANCPTCNDNIQNQGETGVDCGGPCSACASCSDGIQNQGELGIDCGGPCTACPTCNDNIQNQGETGVDCGGPCSACPSCTDGIQNQGETGVDCGGPCSSCATCSDGIQNQGELGVDCGGPCSACPTCNDGIQNQGETGVDCGGPCSSCATCSDGIQNQGELGVDCGGPCPACPTCNDGIHNQGEQAIDCGGPCPACPTCIDGIQNQGEQGVDCGGPCPSCATCNDGIQNQGELGVDCGGPCSACATCNDGVQNQGELGVDCGGPCPACATCNDGVQNQGEQGVDCGGPCPACATCNDGVQNQGEQGVDCGGPCPACIVTCNFTIFNNTACSLSIMWTDGVLQYPGATIPPFSSSTTQITDGHSWSSFNLSDGANVTGFVVANCISLSATVPAGLCVPASLCQDGYENGLISGTEHMEAPNYIISPEPGFNCIISGPGTDVIFDAGNYVELGIGFEVQMGAEFLAVIDGCNGVFRINGDTDKSDFGMTMTDKIVQFSLLKDEIIKLYLINSNGEILEKIINDESLNEGCHDFAWNKTLITDGEAYYFILQTATQRDVYPISLSD